MTRATFFAGLASVAFLPEAVRYIGLPRLHCDFVHDDAPALQAMFNRKPYRDIDGSVKRVTNGNFDGKGRTYTIGSSVIIHDDGKPRFIHDFAIFPQIGSHLAYCDIVPGYQPPLEVTIA